MKALTESFIYVDPNLNVFERLEQLRKWRSEWEQEDALVIKRIDELMEKPGDEQKVMQLASFRQLKHMHLIKQPLVLSPAAIEANYFAIRQNLREQFAKLSPEQSLFWLSNFLLIITSDLIKVHDRITKGYPSFATGPSGSLLLYGPSKTGKSLYLKWYAFQSICMSEKDSIPMVYVDAPISSKSEHFYQRLLLASDQMYGLRWSESALFAKLVNYFDEHSVQTVIVDGIDYGPEIYHALLKISSIKPNITFIGTAVNPSLRTEAEPLIAQLFHNRFRMKLYTGSRLSQFLTYLELLLPFSQDSCLAPLEQSSDLQEIDKNEEPVWWIENRTGGNLRKIMSLIVSASKKAILKGELSLSLSGLKGAWKDLT